MNKAFSTDQLFQKVKTGVPRYIDSFCYREVYTEVTVNLIFIGWQGGIIGSCGFLTADSINWHSTI